MDEKLPTEPVKSFGKIPVHQRRGINQPSGDIPSRKANNRTGSGEDEFSSAFSAAKPAECRPIVKPFLESAVPVLPAL
jgi:hypothetical protein